MCPIIERNRQEAAQEAIKEANISSLRNIMKKLKLTAKQAMEAIEIPESEQAMYIYALFNLHEAEQINLLKDCIVGAIAPIKIYLFGSFANGTNKEESDFDFYVVVDDNEQNLLALTQKAYRSMRGKKNRPVDIVVVRQSRFEERKNWKLSLEREVDDKGVLLYAA